MSDPQRTHKASPKRVKDFRKRGEIALSRDLTSAATLVGGTIALLACAGPALAALLDFTKQASSAGDGRDTGDLARAGLHAFTVAAVPVMAGAAVLAIVAIFGQLGWPPAWKSISFDLGKLSPGKNLPNAFGFAAMARRAGAALAKVVVVGAVVVFALRDGLASQEMSAAGIGAVAWSVVSRALWLVVGSLVAIAAIDYLLARRRITNQMKMTADEVKREHKESDGDPHVKGKRRARMREMAKRRIATTVPTADVVVVNPTHYAVALRYDEDKDRAPIVVAKGTDEMAAKIREIARQSGVPILSRPPLARALHKHVKEGRAIPSNLFRAVAEVLAYVYKLRAGGHS
ncbi:MAG: EscU/YscU/HrcU family type III secretion system export apparatus switch protein [Deltaproteobacteria bacterium]|nr:EscU/YscU/HrcU family type III secretion system export apparatus switch protein [Deltaproteobacteria bacterium]MCW5804096.1 EscU/YscU/HrcU family type III secretion system export apparatus switch protein [Deltaproteobacteria bacterium]